MVQVRVKSNSLNAVVSDQRNEINKFKWIESERAGHDIGWDRAQQEWMLNHCADWIRHGWEEAIDQAMRQACGVATHRTRRQAFPR